MPGDTPERPQLDVYALIGRTGRLLLITTGDEDVYVLPGGPIRPTETVEDNLRRMLREQLDATVKRLSFCAAVEHESTGVQGTTSFRLALLFDVSLADEAPHFDGPDVIKHWWVGAVELESVPLLPDALREGLLYGTLSEQSPWVPWRP